MTAGTLSLEASSIEGAAIAIRSDLVATAPSVSTFWFNAKTMLQTNTTRTVFTTRRPLIITFKNVPLIVYHSLNSGDLPFLTYAQALI
jgi:hypothetical protein